MLNRNLKSFQKSVISFLSKRSDFFFQNNALIINCDKILLKLILINFFKIRTFKERTSVPAISLKFIWHIYISLKADT